MDNTIVPFDNNESEDVFLRVIDTVTGTATTVLVSAAAGGSAVGNGYSDRPLGHRGDGRYVLFRSKASNLVNTSDPLAVPEYYLRDRSSGTTRQISRSGEPDGSNKAAGYGSMSGDGAVVSFEHGSANLLAGDSNGKIDVFVLGVR